MNDSSEWLDCALSGAELDAIARSGKLLPQEALSSHAIREAMA